MTESLAGWLALREAIDHASRSRELTESLRAVLPPDRPLRLVDLGSGTGSNVRYLAPRLPSPQRWLTVDRDAALMSETVWTADAPGASIVVDRHVMDLGRLDPGVIDGAHLVTASALLDLVSERWLRELASACLAAGADALFALTYNGRSRCTPEEPEDDHVRALFNAHQRHSDKGFGAAAGPDGVERAVEAFEAAGYHVGRAASDWILTPDMPALQAQLVDGWAQAAAEIRTAESGVIEDWRQRRQAHVLAGRSTITVSHDDIAASLKPLAGMTVAARSISR